MDPVVAYVGMASLAGILLLGALEKLRRFSLFESAVSGYALLPLYFVRVFALGFLGVELLAGLMLLIPVTRSMGAVMALAVLLVASGGIVFNLLRERRDIDCGCGGFSQQAGGLSWWLVARNGLLAGLAMPVLWPAQGSVRPMGQIDVLTFAGATLAVLGLYFILNLLIDSHTRLQKT